MKEYNHSEIESRWQEYWAQSGLYTVSDEAFGPSSENATEGKKKNYYQLVEFPYPSGNLHVGHWYAFSVPDILARQKRMQGYNVLYPIGFDAFGLPAENAAIKNKLNPADWTEGNMANMRKQIRSMGTMFDWSREVVTCHEDYYKWTQWLFIQFWKAGLVYQKDTLVNWCPQDKTVLANEQVKEGTCDRCGATVEQRTMLQWNIRISKYADRLVQDLEPLDWPSQIKESQKNWIGRSEGAEIDFDLNFGFPPPVKRFVLLHGREAHSKSVFLPWLKEKLEAKGYEVQVPDMPNSANPVASEQMEYVKANCTIDEETAILGHSFGGIVALRLLESGLKAFCVTLLATPHSTTYKDGRPRPTIAAETAKGFDIETIKKNAKRFIVVSDVDDDVVLESDGEAWAEKLGAVRWVGKGERPHFRGKKELDAYEACIGAIRVFTTRPDTLFGATAIVLAPDHKWMQMTAKHHEEGRAFLKNWEAVKAYMEATKKKSDMDRQTSKEKTGVRLDGVTAKNPATGKDVPIFIADYVLAHYGTGAIMTVPAHDERDAEFATAFEIPIVPVNDSKDPFGEEGALINSGEYTGKTIVEAKSEMAEKFGRKKTTYRLRDWIVSRQRYWGVPIPMVHCKECGSLPVNDVDLPVKLPAVEDYLPAGNGKSPLAKVSEFVNTNCPKCGKPAERETDTLDTFVDSSWYFQRYTDPKNESAFADKEVLSKWLPVDLYSGGAEHTTMHLLYSRFWHKAMFDLGFVNTPEPYTRRMNRSLIMGPDGQKMSKSKGNVIDPDEVVARLGADTVRLYLAFIGPYNEVASYPWNPDGVVGVRRFLERVWKTQQYVTDAENQKLMNPLHKAIKKVTEDSKELKFNTAISALMTLQNEIETHKQLGKAQWSIYLKLIAPFAPHMAEELWAEVHAVNTVHSDNSKSSIHLEPWPKFDPALIIDAEVTMVVQINGKVRASLTVARDADEATIKAMAETDVNVQKYISGGVKKVVFVKNKLISFVV